MKENCNSCKFFKIKKHYSMCKRYPPKNTIFKKNLYPETFLLWWCGEWKEHEPNTCNNCDYSIESDNILYCCFDTKWPVEPDNECRHWEHNADTE